MEMDSTKDTPRAAEGLLFDSWIDAIEDGVRNRVREFIETMLEEELSQALARPRYGRREASGRTGSPVIGVRNGHRERSLTGTFWPRRGSPCRGLG
jgi:putative transposase